MLCTVCNHPNHHDIDQALLAGSITLAALSQNYGPSLSALWRHKKHLQKKMRRAEKRLEDNLRQGYLFKFNNFLEVATDTVKTAGADGNSRLVLQAVREGTRILNFMTKLDAKMDQDTVYHLLASPQWTTQSSILPTDPQKIQRYLLIMPKNLYSLFPFPYSLASAAIHFCRRRCPSLCMSTKKTGTKGTANSVEAIMPPKTTVPMAL